MSELLFTPLHDLHLEFGAKMVDFAGYAMPVQYAEGIVKEHLHTRQKASIFDVSHMGQLLVSGAGIDEALEKILPIDVKGIQINRQRYGFLTLENGGILDDLMLARVDENSFYVVINASRKAVDLAHLKKHLAGFQLTELNDLALIALQGPRAAEALATLIPKALGMKFMSTNVFCVDGVDYRVSRSGYTGEDGYEIAIPAESAIAFTKKLLAQEAVALAGLGARDSLRLEAGLCLYGNDIDEKTTPIEADLLWAIQKVRRRGGARAGGFIGADTLLTQIEKGVCRQRVGFSVAGKIPVRAHSELFDENDNKIGEVTSGSFGATVAAPIAMGYVERPFSAMGTEVIAKVRKKTIVLTVTALPLVPQRYYRG